MSDDYILLLQFASARSIAVIYKIAIESYGKHTGFTVNYKFILGDAYET